jgi:hypothetical protein
VIYSHFLFAAAVVTGVPVPVQHPTQIAFQHGENFALLFPNPAPMLTAAIIFGVFFRVLPRSGVSLFSMLLSRPALNLQVTVEAIQPPLALLGPVGFRVGGPHPLGAFSVSFGIFPVTRLGFLSQ